MTHKQIAENLKKINFDKIFKEVFSSQNIQSWVLNTVKNRIQQTGKDSSGDQFKTDSSLAGESYADLTIILKEKFGSGIGAIDSHVTLTQSGKFWDSMRYHLIQGGIQLTADFIKEDGHMFRNFTRDFDGPEDFEEKVLGLTDSELENMLNNMINPLILKKLRETV